MKWIGIENRYFAALLVPGGQGSGEIRAASVPTEDEKTEATALLAVDLDAPALLFVGAKDYHALRRLGHSLEEVVDVGSWIGPIVKPLLSILPRVYGVLGNYGWSILALTVVINLLMAPLRHYGIANSLRMAKVAPEVRAIQERYRKVPLLERQAMNDEVAKVYERHGMNMGTQMTVGCLPMLLTMPFLFAIYRVLQVSIELKGAPFLWIPDLSHQDPYYLTPVLMGVSMLLMQRLTPAGTMDPAQQKMMMIMPVMFTVMFVAAPAGLNLYWLASNVCSIVQQTVTMSLLKGREATPPPPGRRRRSERPRIHRQRRGGCGTDRRLDPRDQGGRPSLLRPRFRRRGAVRRRAEPGPHRGPHGRSHRPQRRGAPRRRPASRPAAAARRRRTCLGPFPRKTDDGGPATTTWRWRCLE